MQRASRACLGTAGSELSRHDSRPDPGPANRRRGWAERCGGPVRPWTGDSPAAAATSLFHSESPPKVILIASNGDLGPRRRAANAPNRANFPRNPEKSRGAPLHRRGPSPKGPGVVMTLSFGGVYPKPGGPVNPTESSHAGCLTTRLAQTAVVSPDARKRRRYAPPERVQSGGRARRHARVMSRREETT